MSAHEHLLTIMVKKPTGFQPWGDVERDGEPDCSCGCQYYLELPGELAADWGVCTNQESPRAGLLTFEHQAGDSCFSLGEPGKCERCDGDTYPEFDGGRRIRRCDDCDSYVIESEVPR